MGTPGPQKVKRYGLEFKLKAVQMSNQPGVLVRDVAESLCIHPFMLSRWRKQVREGVLAGDAPRGGCPSAGRAAAAAHGRAAVQALAAGARPAKKIHPVRGRSKEEAFGFIAANRQTHSIQMMCRLHGVTRGGFYAWASRSSGVRQRADAALCQHIERVHAQSRGYYGSPRIHAQLRQQGHTVGRRRVARLMRLCGLQGRSARNTRRSSVAQRAFFASVPNRQRKLELSAPDQVWVADVTYLRVNRQWRYFATVMDKYSRRVLGWSLGHKRDTALTTQALQHATRKRSVRPGLVFHTDRGMEYAALEFKRLLERQGFIQSMNRPGKMNDNAHGLSLECQLMRGKFPSNIGLRQLSAAPHVKR